MAHPGSRVRETEISDVATTSTLTWFSRNTLNTLRARQVVSRGLPCMHTAGIS